MRLTRMLCSLAFTAVFVAGCTGSGTSDTAAESVRSAVTREVQQYALAMALPDDIADRQAVLTAEEDSGSELTEQSAASRAGRLREVWHSSVADARIAETLAALHKVEDDASYGAFSDAKFTVAQWEKVSVHGSRAQATLQGHISWLIGAGWKEDPVERWKIELALDRSSNGPGEWRLVSFSRIALAGQG